MDYGLIYQWCRGTELNRSFYSRTLCRAFADLHGIGEENFNRLIKNRALINRLEWREISRPS